MSGMSSIATLDAARPATSLPQVLVVDDAHPDRTRLIEILRRMGLVPFGAGSAQEALACLASQRIDVIISDWMMPGMSGVELCRRVLQEPRFGRPHFIMVTGRSQPADLIAGMDAGADDFLAKPVSREELRVRVQAGLRMLSLRRELQDGQQTLERALAHEAARTKRLHEDLAAAAQLQSSLLPRPGRALPDWSIDRVFEPVDTIGGDMLGLHVVEPGILSFFSLDACGHGIPAAMQSIAHARCLTPGPRDACLLFGASDQGLNPTDAVMGGLNIVCCADAHAPPLAAAYGQIDSASGQGALCLAGHPHALLLRRDGGFDWIGEAGLPVGASTRAVFAQSRFHMHPGDQLVLFSDGILDGTDARTTYPQARARLAECLAAAAHGGPTGLSAVLRAYAPPTAAESADDRSALLIRRGEASCT